MSCWRAERRRGHVRRRSRSAQRDTSESSDRLVVCALAACPVVIPGRAVAADKITVGVLPITDVAPHLPRRPKGRFSRQKLDVTLQIAQGGAELVAPVMTGQREFGFSNVTSLLMAQARGLDIVAVAAGASSTGEQGRDFGAIIVPAKAC